MKLLYFHLGRIIFFVAIVFPLCTTPLYSQQDTSKNFIGMSLEELMEIKVVTASKVSEKLIEAPASMKVITKDDIKQRGYNNLVEIFQDLPGIDLSLAYADTYYKAYWRGYRTGMADSWQFMIDGRIMNHLWYNFNNIMIAIPLSNVEQIEVVYGPASAVYGANAMSGAINIITKKNSDFNGVSVDAKLSTGSFSNRLADVNLFIKQDDLRISTTAYYSHGNLDTVSLSRFEWTNPKYLRDRKLWGAYIDNPTIAGTPSAPQNNKSFGINLLYQDMEIGWTYQSNDNCYGINYPFDKMQISPKWIEWEQDLFLKHSYKFSENFSTSGMLRYRYAAVDNESTSVEASGEYGTPPLIAFGYWQSLSRSYSATQDFEITASEYLSFKAGIKYEIKDLQKAYDLPYGLWLPPDSVTSLTIPGLFPTPPSDVFRNENHDTWIEEGGYVQGKFNFSYLIKSSDTHILNLGFRYNNHSYYGVNTTIRAGYTGLYGPFHLKFFYGEGYNEPAPRQLFGGWAALGSNPNLEPETSKSFEFVFGYTTPVFNISINPFYNKMNNVIMDIASSSKNHGAMHTEGFDVTVQTILNIRSFKKFTLLASYSYLNTSEFKYNAQTGIQEGIGPIGDMANHKFHFIANAVYYDFSLTLAARYIGERTTVDSNPIRKVDPYFTLDMNLIWENVFYNGFNLSLKVTNLLDAEYFHAGIRKANSGDTPGYWIGNKWYGSRGFYNSLLPQPGRAFMVSLSYQI